MELVWGDIRKFEVQTFGCAVLVALPMVLFVVSLILAAAWEK